MEKDPKDSYSNEVLEENRDRMIMDALLRITALENILMRKNIVSDEEIKNEILSLSNAITKSVAEKLIKIEGIKESNVEDWVDDFNSPKKKDHTSN